MMKSKILHNAVCLGNEKVIDNHISVYGLSSLEKFANSDFRYIDYLFICGHFNIIKKYNISYDDKILNKMVYHIIRNKKWRNWLENYNINGKSLIEDIFIYNLILSSTIHFHKFERFNYLLKHMSIDLINKHLNEYRNSNRYDYDKHKSKFLGVIRTNKLNELLT